MNLWGPIGVLWFEFRRSISVGRLALWLMLILFPVVLISLARMSAPDEVPDDAFVVMLFFLIVRVTCVLGLLLWATPAISNEIEGRTWIYVVTRPGGGLSIVLGKFAVALVWSMTIGLISVPFAVLASGVADFGRIWFVLTILALLSCLAYGSLFTLIGTLIQRRAMVVAIVYLVLIEGVLTLVPATINKITVGFRLLALLMQWTVYENQEIAQEFELLFGNTSAWTHVAVLAIYTSILLGAALVRVRMGGYLTEPED